MLQILKHICKLVQFYCILKTSLIGAIKLHVTDIKQDCILSEGPTRRPTSRHFLYLRETKKLAFLGRVGTKLELFSAG